jgi:hypothetical protein
VLTLGANGLPKRKTPGPTVRKPELHIFDIHALEGRWAERGISSDKIVADDAAAARRNGATAVFADDYMGLVLQSAYARERLAYVPQKWTVESKGEALSQVRQWLADGVLVIEPSAEGRKLVDEMVNLSETMRPSGALSIGARTGHDDRWACLANIALAQAALLLPPGASPVAKSRGLRVDAPGQPTRHYGT